MRPSLAFHPGIQAFTLFAASCLPSTGLAQTTLATVPAFRLDSNPLVIQRAARPNQPFSVTGERGAILGQQDGTFEVWLLPVKVLHNARLTARLKGYDAPIDLNEQASSIEVRPDHTTITYVHAGITVRQHMFIPHTSETGVASAVVLFEVHAVRPAELSLTFEPSLERQWPAPNFGRPTGGWIAAGSGGAYSLGTDNPAFFGVVAMPNAQPGPLRPYQERAKTESLVFHFSYDPAKDDGVFYPLLAAVSDGKSSGPAARADLLARLLAKQSRVAEMYRSTSDFYDHFFDKRLTISTPDAHINDALRWAEVSIEQSRVATADGSGLAGGWSTSGDSARPGFGWFFGRDTLWTLYAVNSYGDFALSRNAMNFLLAHQRADGKMMHEYSQTAPEVDWAHLPYLYASADSTPLFVMQMEDYVRASGDLSYLREHWDNVKRAYAFTRAHTTDGVYDNGQGTGWVEEWVPKMPHQEIYLAALDQQSADSMSRLAKWMNEDTLSTSAAQTAEEIKGKLAAYRAQGQDGTYSFSRNLDGSYEAVPSIFPTVAWWTGRLMLPEAKPTFDAWAGHRFATDWGTRSVAADAAIYDPISYHHGSVWPLYTGWTAMAEYRTGRSLQAYANLNASAQLTWLQDPGAITEVISGEFLEPLGRSSSHQLWSSAMLLAPAIRGLFGVEANALTHTLAIAPQLPATWNEATLDHVAVGDQRYKVTFHRNGSHLDIDASSTEATTLCLTQDITAKPCSAKPEQHHRASLPLPPVEVSTESSPATEGASTSNLKVIDVQRSDRTLILTLEAPGGTTQHLQVRKNDTKIQLLPPEGGTLEGNRVSVAFSATPGAQYQKTTVKLRW
ncbi:glycogen debranching protein [Granulicella sp. dw_53]|uniref:amylo-alpha-1,6-glucosidase n=1 Tax=Granulicella sp. dw_53 TaxID=2719792 RepID=UPI001BD6CC91|nr:glycogen debranching protein [Granulicella sp. dw_53]